MDYVVHSLHGFVVGARDLEVRDYDEFIGGRGCVEGFEERVVEDDGFFGGAADGDAHFVA